jgi:hypothetical protein
MSAPKKLRNFDFGAKTFFQWLANVGSARITAAAWTTSIAAFVAVAIWDLSVMDRKKGGHRTVLTDLKPPLRRVISSALGYDRPSTSSGITPDSKL